MVSSPIAFPESGYKAIRYCHTAILESSSLSPSLHIFPSINGFHQHRDYLSVYLISLSM